MNYKEIGAALNEQGYSWTSAAKVIDKSTTAVCRVCKRTLDSKNVAQKICVLIDLDIEEVFPDKPEYFQDIESDQEKLIAAGRQKLIDAGLAQAS